MEGVGQGGRGQARAAAALMTRMQPDSLLGRLGGVRTIETSGPRSPARAHDAGASVPAAAALEATRKSPRLLAATALVGGAVATGTTSATAALGAARRLDLSMRATEP